MQVVNFTAKSGTTPLTWPEVEPKEAGPVPPIPYVFGSTAAGGGFRNDSMPTWGGNVVQGDDEKYHLFAAGFVNAAGIGAWEANSQVIHAVGSSPGGPFLYSDVALPTWHHNPDINRCPVTGEFVLYTISCFSTSKDGKVVPPTFDARNGCVNCHKGHCGPVKGENRPGPKPEGVMTLQRRERPKIFLDKTGKATWLYNGVGLDSGNRPFTMATPILDDVPSNFPRRADAGISKTDDEAGPATKIWVSTSGSGSNQPWHLFSAVPDSTEGHRFRSPWLVTPSSCAMVFTHACRK